MNVDSDEDVWSWSVPTPPAASLGQGQDRDGARSPGRLSITSVGTLANPFTLSESEAKVLPRFDSKEGEVYNTNQISPPLETWERILYVYEETDIIKRRIKKRERQIRELEEFDKWLEKENKLLAEELDQCIVFSPKAFLTMFISCLLLNYAFSPMNLSQLQTEMKK